MKNSFLAGFVFFVMTQVSWAQVAQNFTDYPAATAGDTPGTSLHLSDAGQWAGRLTVAPQSATPILHPAGPEVSIRPALERTDAFVRRGSSMQLNDFTPPARVGDQLEGMKRAGSISLAAAFNCKLPTGVANSEAPPPDLAIFENWNDAGKRPVVVDYFAPASVPKTWTSPDFFHRPLYFEDSNLERYGLHRGCLQNCDSGLRFMADTFFLPYKMWVEPPHSCVYPIGKPRPGDCAPAVEELPPCSLAGAGAQSLSILGLTFGL